MDDLISALDAIGTAACIDASCRLRASLLGATTFDLHLRDVSLGIQDAFSLAKAIQNISSKPKLRSFSASYNPTLTESIVCPQIIDVFMCFEFPIFCFFIDFF